MTARVEAERAIADVLLEHRIEEHSKWGRRWRCTCGEHFEVETVFQTLQDYRAHVASVLADLMAERQAEAWAAGYRKGADDHYQCGDTCKVSTEAPNPYRPDPKDTRDE